ncbi:MAG: hypothetical protein ACLQVL_06985 [Terriglobia bacterium]
MPTVDEVKQVRNRLNAYRGNRVLAVAISYEEWIGGTTLGLLHPRSRETRAVERSTTTRARRLPRSSS